MKGVVTMVMTNTGKYQHFQDPRFPGQTMCSRAIRMDRVNGGTAIPDPDAPVCSHCLAKPVTPATS